MSGTTHILLSTVPMVYLISDDNVDLSASQPGASWGRDWELRPMLSEFPGAMGWALGLSSLLVDMSR